MDVLVVGSSNYDMFTYVSRFPEPGETITGEKFLTGFGGKGANQAVCASVLGAKVGIVSSVGNDDFGDKILKNFKSYGIDTGFVKVAREVSTGLANITVDSKGENHIVIVPGANATLNGESVNEAAKLISRSKIVLCQNEISLEATLSALKCARSKGVRTMFNPSPMQEFPEELFGLVDFWCLNQTELDLLIGKKTSSKELDEVAIKDVCIPLQAKSGCDGIILTLGSKGAAVIDGNEVTMVPPAKINKESIRDTTGAGDCFLATVAVCLSQGKGIIEAATTACATAGISVQYEGCQASYKHLEPIM
mmetsp:Transcript_12211/g.14187  ORF Transcript_12211/g.14187 Transcript_12211/m.14187 type:complete len:307 (+) Transcript_12211:95-1015(+)